MEISLVLQGLLDSRRLDHTATTPRLSGKVLDVTHSSRLRRGLTRVPLVLKRVGLRHPSQTHRSRDHLEPFRGSRCCELEVIVLLLGEDGALSLHSHAITLKKKECDRRLLDCL